MKKKLVTFLAISLMTLSLSACSFVNDLFSKFLDFGGFGDNQYVASSRKQVSDIPTPPADTDITAQKASVNYSNYIENNVYAISATPSVGTAKLLIIPIWFNDSSTFIKSANKNKVRDDINSAYFGDVDKVGWQSVKTYYETESYGSLSLNGTVSEWYEVNKSYKDFTVDNGTEGNPIPKTRTLLNDAISWYFSSHLDESRTDYDCDGDGYLDGVMMIYGAPDYGALNNSKFTNLWAYCFWLQDYSKQNVIYPGANAFFWASYDYMYGSEVVSSRTGSRYFSGDTSHCSLDTHTFIHEMGHMFGLEDYYDYSDFAYSPAGSFSMQDQNVGGHDPFSSFALGWGKAYIPNKSTTIDLKPFATSGEMIILSPSWNEQNSPFDEYLILEYYTDQALNELDSSYGYRSQYSYQYPTGSKEYGIRLWHVDARLLYTSTGSFSSKKITTNPNILTGRVTMMNSNTYDDGTEETLAYCGELVQNGTNDSRYANYNILHLIRNKTTSNTKPKDSFNKGSLFQYGDTFSMNKFNKQFVNSGKFNSGINLGFEFEINACNSTYASISIKKV